MYEVFRGWAWRFFPRSAWGDLKPNYESNAKTGKSGGPAIYPRSNWGGFRAQKSPENPGPGRVRFRLAEVPKRLRAGPARPGEPNAHKKKLIMYYFQKDIFPKRMSKDFSGKSFFGKNLFKKN